MVTTLKTSVSLKKTLLTQAENLAQQLHISRNQLFEIALEHFIQDYQNQPEADEVTGTSADQNEPARSSRHDDKSARQIGEERVINQGDVYWVQLEDPGGFEPGIRHPHVIIQDNVFNHSRISTVVVCALTSNIKRTNIPGTVLLDAGEANLPKQSLVETSKVSSVDKTRLGEYIGSLSEQRVMQILAGMRFLQTSFLAR